MNVRLYCCMCRQISTNLPLQALADGDALDAALRQLMWRSFVRLGDPATCYAVCRQCTPDVLKRINGGGSV